MALKSTKAVLQLLDELNDKMKKLDEVLNIVMATKLNDRLNTLNAVEFTELNVLLAFVFGSLYFAYVKVSGEDTTKHPIMSEMDRLKLYMKKVLSYKESLNPPERRPFCMDRESIKRIVKFYTAANDTAPLERCKDVEPLDVIVLKQPVVVVDNDAEPTKKKRKKKKVQQHIQIENDKPVANSVDSESKRKTKRSDVNGAAVSSKSKKRRRFIESSKLGD